MGLLDMGSSASPAPYKPLNGDEKGMTTPISPLLTRLLSNGNVVGQGRKYLTEQVTPRTPQGRGALDDAAGQLQRVPSWEKLHANTQIHNCPHNEMSTSDGSFRSRVLSAVKPLQPGSNRTCVLTLAATALGSGVLALPYAFSHVGLMVGLLVLTLAACLSCVSLVILMVAARYTEAESFAALLALAAGSSKAGLVLDACLVIYGCTALLALLIFEGDFVPAILDAFGLPSLGRTLSIIGVAALAWPFVLPAKISALRYVAALSPFAILYVAGNVVVQTPAYYHEALLNDSKPVLWMFKPVQMLQALSIFVFSVMCHANAVPVVHILDRPSVARIVKVATYSNTCCWTLYVLIGVGGYLSFQGNVQGDFILNYPDDSKSMLCCRVMMAVVCFVGIPMNSGNCVMALQKLLAAAWQRNPEPEMEDRPLLFALLATVVLSIATVGAIHLTDVAKVISVAGGSLTTLQMFWIPAYVYWKILYPSQPRVFRICVLATMISAGVAGFSSVIATFAAAMQLI